jgi:hypothetical protein
MNLKRILSTAISIYYYALFFNGWIVILLLAHYLDLSLYKTIIIGLVLVIVGVLLMIVDDVYGLNSKCGIYAKIKRFYSARKKNKEMLIQLTKDKSKND